MDETSFPTIPKSSVGWLSTEQMIEVDRIMIEDLHIELIQMMENAGRNLARLALTRFSPAHVTVCAGSGGNGGGGLVAARHLHVSGVDVEVVLSSPADRFDGVPSHQLDIIERLGISPVMGISPQSDLILDAMIGYSLKGAPTGRAAELIVAANDHPAPILALDAPSGIDAATGTAYDPHIAAAATLTLALPKHGLSDQPSVGDLYLADISVPPSVYTNMGAGPAPDFSAGPILKIT